MHHLILTFVLDWRLLTALALAIPLALAGLSPAYAQPYGDNRYDNDRDADDRPSSGYRRGEVIRCESTDQDYRHCRADTRDGVRLYRQLSNNACRYNDTWGYDRRGVWVDRGCRGEFQLYTGSSGGDGKDKGKDHTVAMVGGVVALGVLGAILSEQDKKRDPGPPARRVRCDSDGDYRHCRADIRGRANLYRQLSRASCRYNDTWGYDRRGVWVDNGCRAEFTLD
jgi:hypothetical protein